MKTEVSDIDFSWVNDVENRLEREIAFVREGFIAIWHFFELSMTLNLCLYIFHLNIHFSVFFLQINEQFVTILRLFYFVLFPVFI